MKELQEQSSDHDSGIKLESQLSTLLCAFETANGLTQIAIQFNGLSGPGTVFLASSNASFAESLLPGLVKPHAQLIISINTKDKLRP